MQAVPNEILQRAYQRRPERLIKLAVFWGIIAAFGYLAVWASRHLGTGAAVAVGIGAGFLSGMLVRGLGSMGHDAVHGSVSSNKVVAYVVGFLAWSATFMSYTLYKTYHLDHHRIVNMPHDVDRVQTSRFTSNPRLAVLLRLFIFSFGYPMYWAREVGRYAKKMPLSVKLTMYVELLVIFGAIGGMLPLMGTVAWFSFMGTMAVTGAFFASITSMSEHYGINYNADHAYSSRTYATESPLIDFIWSGTNFHNEHHKYPGIPYYNLRSFHHEAMPHYSEAVRKNVYPDFWPVVFSLWRRASQMTIEEEREMARHDAELLEKAA
jgi:fatty acid desaturase